MKLILLLITQAAQTVPDTTSNSTVVEVVDSGVKAISLNHWVIFVTVILTIVGFILSFYFYFKSKREKRFSCVLQGFSLIQENLKKTEGVEVLYNGLSVKSLSIAKIAFWNNGTEVISREDLVKNVKFTLSFPNGAKAFNYELIKSTNPASGVKLTSSEINDGIYIDFEYLNAGDGFVIKFYHTTLPEDKINVNCAIKGVKEIKFIPLSNLLSTPFGGHNNALGKAGYIYMAFIAPLMVFLLFTVSIFRGNSEVDKLTFSFWLCLVAFISFLLFRFITTFFKETIKKYPIWLKESFSESF